MIDFGAVMMYNGCATVRRTEAIFLFDPLSFCAENNPHIIKTEAYQPNRPSVCRRKANEDRAGAPLAFLNQEGDRTGRHFEELANLVHYRPNEYAIYRRGGEWFDLAEGQVTEIMQITRFEDGWFLTRRSENITE